MTSSTCTGQDTGNLPRARISNSRFGDYYICKIEPFEYKYKHVCDDKYSNMTSIKRHTRYYSISLYLAQVRYTTNLAVPCDSHCEITVTTECKQAKHWHIAYF
jgi:hypothetical protein